MLPGKRQIRDLYRRRARRFDLSFLIFRLCGFRISHYRRRTVESLRLAPGDTVVDLACGTGLNFPLLVKAVGPGGRVVGVDLTDSMLELARRRVRAAGWDNVTLVESDLVACRFPARVDAILSTFSLVLVPDYQVVIERAAAALAPGGRLALFDLKEPERWPRWLVRLVAWLDSPYGVSVEQADRRPWETLRRHLRQIRFREYYFGVLYLAVGEAQGVPSIEEDLSPDLATVVSALRGLDDDALRKAARDSFPRPVTGGDRTVG